MPRVLFFSEADDISPLKSQKVGDEVVPRPDFKNTKENEPKKEYKLLHPDILLAGTYKVEGEELEIKNGCVKTTVAGIRDELMKHGFSLLYEREVIDE